MGIKKFINFLSQISDRDNRFLLFRNDGSLEHLDKNLKFPIPENFGSILDNGFFMKISMKPSLRLNLILLSMFQMTKYLERIKCFKNE